MTTPTASAARADLARSGVLRVGLNMSNFLLVGVDPATGKHRGIVPDLATELARRLNVPIQFIPYVTPGKVCEAIAADEWDVAFLGAEPARATEIFFTPHYLGIDATFLVQPGSRLHKVADVDQPGVRIVAMASAAYELHLRHTLKHATLLNEKTMEAACERFVSDGLDALAGLRVRLVKDAENVPGSRVLEDGFHTVQQAIGTPRNRTVGAQYLHDFALDMIASGRVAEIIRNQGVVGVTPAK